MHRLRCNVFRNRPRLPRIRGVLLLIANRNFFLLWCFLCYKTARNETLPKLSRYLLCIVPLLSSGNDRGTKTERSGLI